MLRTKEDGQTKECLTALSLLVHYGGVIQNTFRREVVEETVEGEFQIRVRDPQGAEQGKRTGVREVVQGTEGLPLIKVPMSRPGPFSDSSSP